MSRSEEDKSRVPVILGLCIAVIIVAVSMLYWAAISETPTANAINAAINASDTTGNLRVVSLSMAAPDYLAGQGGLEKTYQSSIELALRNASAQDAYLALMYSVDAGTVRGYSPGSLIGAEVIRVKGDWSGARSVPIRHTRFVSGGSISIEIGTCAGPERSDASLFHSPDQVDLFYKGTHVIVP